MEKKSYIENIKEAIAISLESRIFEVVETLLADEGVRKEVMGDQRVIDCFQTFAPDLYELYAPVDFDRFTNFKKNDPFIAAIFNKQTTDLPPPSSYNYPRAKILQDEFLRPENKDILLWSLREHPEIVDFSAVASSKNVDELYEIVSSVKDTFKQNILNRLSYHKSESPTMLKDVLKAIFEKEGVEGIKDLVVKNMVNFDPVLDVVDVKNALDIANASGRNKDFNIARLFFNNMTNKDVQEAIKNSFALAKDKESHLSVFFVNNRNAIDDILKQKDKAELFFTILSEPLKELAIKDFVNYLTREDNCQQQQIELATKILQRNNKEKTSAINVVSHIWGDMRQNKSVKSCLYPTQINALKVVGEALNNALPSPNFNFKEIKETPNLAFMANYAGEYGIPFYTVLDKVIHSSLKDKNLKNITLLNEQLGKEFITYCTSAQLNGEFQKTFGFDVSDLKYLSKTIPGTWKKLSDDNKGSLLPNIYGENFYSALSRDIFQSKNLIVKNKELATAFLKPLLAWAAKNKNDRYDQMSFVSLLFAAEDGLGSDQKVKTLLNDSFFEYYDGRKKFEDKFKLVERVDGLKSITPEKYNDTVKNVLLESIKDDNYALFSGYYHNVFWTNKVSEFKDDILKTKEFQQRLDDIEAGITKDNFALARDLVSFPWLCKERPKLVTLVVNEDIKDLRYLEMASHIYDKRISLDDAVNKMKQEKGYDPVKFVDAAFGRFEYSRARFANSFAKLVCNELPQVFAFKADSRIYDFISASKNIFTEINKVPNKLTDVDKLCFYVAAKELLNNQNGDLTVREREEAKSLVEKFKDSKLSIPEKDFATVINNSAAFLLGHLPRVCDKVLSRINGYANELANIIPTPPEEKKEYNPYNVEHRRNF